MIDVIEINEHNLWFRSDIGDLFGDIKPKFAATHRTFHEIYWVPVSKYILQKMLSYEYNEQLALALEKLESKAIQIQINAKNNQNDLLRDYQKLGVARIQADNHLLIWEMQTGKTATVCNALANTNKAIVFIEKGHEYKWIEEFKKFANRTDVYLISSKMDENQRCDFVDDLVERQDKFILLMNSHLLTKTSCLYGIKRFDHMVIDEGHWLTNPKTKRSWRMNNLRNRVDKVCILSGTPTNKSPAEIIELLKFMYGQKKFAKCNYHPYFFEQIKSYYTSVPVCGKLLDNRKEEWKSFLEQYSSNVLMHENLKPKVKRVSQILTLHPDHKQLYQKLIQSYSYGDITLNHVVQLIVRAQQMALCPQLLQLDLPPEHEAKWVWLQWYLKQNPYEQIIVFSPFTSYLDVLFERLVKLGYQCNKVTGQTSANKRNQAVNAFQNKKVQILLANTIAGSKGWTLNQADTIIFLSRDWSPINNDQAEARFNAQGVGINHNKKIIDVIADNTIEEHVINVINNKWDKTKVVNEYIKILTQERTRNFGN